MERSWLGRPDRNNQPGRPKGSLGRSKREREEQNVTENCDCQSGTLVLEDTDTDESIGSSRREYLLEEVKKRRSYATT